MPSIFIEVIYRYIFIFINCLNKIRYLVPVISIEIDEARDAFYAHIYKYYRLPDILVLDRDF